MYKSLGSHSMRISGAMSNMGVLIDGETIFMDMQFLFAFDSFKFNVFGRDNGDDDEALTCTLCLHNESMLGDNLL